MCMYKIKEIIPLAIMKAAPSYRLNSPLHFPTWSSSTDIESESIGQFILTLNKAVGRFMIACNPNVEGNGKQGCDIHVNFSQQLNNIKNVSQNE